MTNITKNISAVILAGGKSSRMGTDKALVTFQGQPILQRVYQAAAACTEQVYVLSPWSDRYSRILPTQCHFLNEQKPDMGSLYALYQALQQLNTEWILLLACDLPLVNPQILQEWIDNLPQVPKTTLAVVPKQNSYWEPLCGFYRDRAITPLTDFIESGGRSFQKWFANIEVQALSVTPGVSKMLHNCNTPADLQSILLPSNRTKTEN